MTRSDHHPLAHGDILPSPGRQFQYRVIGPCCRLFDREQLPWPCCRLQWRGKEPSWRRVGRRLVPDMAAKRYPSYSVALIGYGETQETMILTVYTARLSSSEQNWWYSRNRLTQREFDG